MIPFSIIVAVDLKNGIGKNGTLPWHLPDDLKHFKEITMQTEAPRKKNFVIMGRKTWESLPDKFKPLSGRINVVLTQNPEYPLPRGVLRVGDFAEAIDIVNSRQWVKQTESAFIIGGEAVFKSALESGLKFKIYLTQVLGDFQCDTFFPDFMKNSVSLYKSPEYFADHIRFFFTEYRQI